MSSKALAEFLSPQKRRAARAAPLIMLLGVVGFLVLF
jgi:hypothetical protein